MTTVGKVVRRGWALFALPTVLCFAVFFVVPLAMGIYLSFTSFRTVTDAKWVGLKNYVDALSDPEFGAALWRSVLFTIVTTIIINVISFLLAYMFTKAMRGANLFRSVFFMPNLIGGIVLGYLAAAVERRPRAVGPFPDHVGGLWLLGHGHSDVLAADWLYDGHLRCRLPKPAD